MELDDLKSTWQTLNDRLDRQASQQARIYRETRLDKVSRGLRPLIWGQGLQILFGVLLALASASFWIHHRGTPHLLVAGLMMHAYGLAMIICGGRMQALISHIDYSAPVVEIQRSLAELRKFFVACGKWIGLPWFVLWVPLIQMMLMEFFGADLYLNAPLMVISNLVAGALLWMLVLVLGRWARSRPSLATKAEDVMAGKTLNRAQRELEAIVRFEQEG